MTNKKYNDECVADVPQKGCGRGASVPKVRAMEKEIDITIGKQVQALRKVKGMTRTNLALQMGISQQQLQKCELGDNRFSAARLFIIAGLLDVDITVFFTDIPTESTKQSRAKFFIQREFAAFKPEEQDMAVGFVRMARQYVYNKLTSN